MTSLMLFWPAFYSKYEFPCVCHVYRYCNQVLDKDIDECCTELLQDLVRFQEQSFSREPSKV